MGELSELKGIGPESEKRLNAIGIFTKQQLQDTGPVAAFIKLTQLASVKPSLNFLYAMVGALEDQHWAGIARTEKDRLLIELEAYRELEKLLQVEQND